MSYFSYIEKKLGLTNSDSIIDKAIYYIGNSFPNNNNQNKKYEIVDSWIDSIIQKWKIEFRILNLSKGTFHGKLEPRKNGFYINLNKNLFSTQKRFTIAHEIAHLLSFNISSDWPVYEIIHSKDEEDFCDKLARAILLPKTLIDLSKFDLTNFTQDQALYIKKLWPEFQVSPWQIIKRILDECPDTTIAIQWELFPEEDCFKIIASHSPKHIFIPKKDRAFINNMFQEKKTNFAPEKAYKDEFYSGVDTIEIGSLYKKKLHTIAFSVITSHATYIIQLINA